jgi:Ca-activated chloride channel family protein
MRRRFRQIAALLAAIVGMMAATGAPAESPAPTVMLFVDSSGSMWARLDPEHRAKIDIVRDKLTSLLEMPSSAKIGLVAVGHRRRGDCKDVEVIARPGDERSGMVQRLAKLNPIGPGPITAGLKAAVDAIGDTRPAQIVMVGDGADNCRQDPCQFASELAKTSPGITIQVIEIGVSAADRSRVACIAEATGGRYYDITDSDGLKAALDEAYKVAIRSPDASPAASASNSQAPPPPAGASFSASASLADGGPLLQVPIRWRIYKSGNDTVLGESKGRGISAKVPPGSYDIEAELGSLSARNTVTIEAGKPQSIVVPLGGGHLLIRAVSAKGSSPSPSAVLTIASSDKTIAIARGGTADLYLSPSSYTVNVADGLAHASQSVALAAGDDKPMDIALGTGRLEITAASADGAPISDILYAIFEDDPESPDGRREIARSRAPHASFTLPAGTYYVSARSGGAETQERVAVGTGDTLQRTLSLPRASLKISAIVAGVPANASQGVLYTVHRLDGGNGDRIPPRMGPEVETALPPGQYRVTASLPADHLSASQDVTLDAGKTTTLQLQVQASEVTLKLPVGSTTLAGDLFWKVTGEDGKRIRRATGTNATMLLAPGHYTVDVDARGKHKTAAFDVRPGEKQQIEIDPG